MTSRIFSWLGSSLILCMLTLEWNGAIQVSFIANVIFLLSLNIKQIPICIVQNMISKIAIGSMLWCSTQWLSNFAIVLFPSIMRSALIKRWIHSHKVSFEWDLIYFMRYHQCPQEFFEDLWEQRFNLDLQKKYLHDHHVVDAAVVSLYEVGALPDETYGDILHGYTKCRNEDFKAVFQHLVS